MYGNTEGFLPQTQNLDLRTEQIVHVKLLLKRFDLSGNTISTDLKVKGRNCPVIIWSRSKNVDICRGYDQAV